VVKIQEKNGQFVLTLSKDIIKLVKWNKGDEIAITTDQYNKDIILKKI